MKRLEAQQRCRWTVVEFRPAGERRVERVLDDLGDAVVVVEIAPSWETVATTRHGYVSHRTWCALEARRMVEAGAQARYVETSRADGVFCGVVRDDNPLSRCSGTEWDG